MNSDELVVSGLQEMAFIPGQCFYLLNLCMSQRGFPGGSVDKESACQCREMQETWVQSLGREDLLEEVMATHSSVLVWRFPWTEEPCGLQSVGLQRVGHDGSD